MPKRRVRNVSDLNQQQLQHKRDADRKAQRALRERTRTRIQILEEELADLRESTSEQSATMNETLSTLRDENARLRKTLEQIGRLALSNETQTEVDEDFPRQSIRGTGVDVDDGMTVNTEPRDYSEPNVAGPTSEEAISTPLRVGYGLEQLHALETSSEDLVMASSVDGTPTTTVANGVDSQWFTSDHLPTTSSASPLVNQTNYSHSGSNLQYNTVSVQRPDGSTPSIPIRDYYLDGIRETSDNDRNLRTGDTTPCVSVGCTFGHSGHLSNDFGSVWSFLPKHLPATCPLDHILLDFLASRRSMRASGASTEYVLGPTEPSIIGLITPMVSQTLHPVSRVMAEIFSTFAHVAVTEKIGFMYKMHRTLRWQIAPDKENYEQLPLWLRPTATQLTVPHAAWIDNIPWPAVRDILIQKPDKYPFEVFSEFYSRNVTVNWPYEPLDAVIRRTTNGVEEAVLNPIFEKHVRKLSNWTVQSQFERQFPELYLAIHYRD